MGITDVADLRSPREVERRSGDAVRMASRYTCCRFPDLATTTAEAPHETSWRQMMTEYPGDGDAAAPRHRFMTAEYQKFPSLGGAQRAVRQLISLLGDGQTVITHCFAGKDRTGFAVATVLETVGCPEI